MMLRTTALATMASEATPASPSHADTILSTDARLLVNLPPAALKGLVSELEDCEPRDDHLQDVERLVLAAARYGVAITGPPRLDGRAPGIERAPWLKNPARVCFLVGTRAP